MFKLSGFFIYLIWPLITFLMKQREYDQWNDPQEFYSDDYFFPKKELATPYEY